MGGGLQTRPSNRSRSLIHCNASFVCTKLNDGSTFRRLIACSHNPLIPFTCLVLNLFLQHRNPGASTEAPSYPSQRLPLPRHLLHAGFCPYRPTGLSPSQTVRIFQAGAGPSLISRPPTDEREHGAREVQEASADTPAVHGDSRVSVGRYQEAGSSISLASMKPPFRFG